MQFSLRRLFIIVAAASVLMAILSFATRDWRHRMAIRSDLSSMGAYWVDFSEDNSPVHVAFHDPVGSPEIAKYEQIAVVDLKAAHVTSESLDNISRLQEVKLLILNISDVQDKHLEPLMKIGNLEVLSLHGTSISDAAIDTICMIPGLERVDFEKTQVTPAGVERLQDARPELIIGPIFK